MKNTRFDSIVRPKTAVVLLCLFLMFTLSSCGTSRLADRGGLDPEISKLLKTPVSVESYPDAYVVYLLDEVIEEVFPDGRSNRTVHQTFTIVSETGKYWADQEIGFNSRTETATLLYARTITPEGKSIPLKENAIKIVTPYSCYPSYSDYKRLTFSLPGATVGSTIDYKYVVEEKEPTFQGVFTDQYFVQWYNPTLLARYKIIAPQDMKLRYRASNPPKGFSVAPTVTNHGDKKAYLWEYRNIPQILDEDDKPPMEEIAFNILVTSMDSWKRFFRWWREEIEAKPVADPAIKDKVAQLTAALSSTEEKIAALYDYVKQEIRYVSIGLGKSGYTPEAAPEVFENKYGDCKDQSTLLIAMLRDAGISASYVLIPTHSRRNLIVDFPYPFQFNHCIVAVENERGHHFLDPTAQYHRFDYLPEYDQNRGVLIFKDHKTIFSHTPLDKPEANGYISQNNIEIKTDGSIEITERNLTSGDNEASQRQFYTEYTPIEIKETLEEIVNDLAPGAKLMEYDYTNPLDFQARFTESVKVRAPDYCKKAGDILIFQLPDIEISFFGASKEERRYPIVRKANSHRKNVAAFNIPKGYEVYHLPEPVQIENPYFEYRSSYRMDGGKVFFLGECITRAGLIPPQAYEGYRRSAQDVEKSCERYVLFREKI